MRLPLQAGNSALKSLLKASALLVPGSLLTLGAIYLVFELGIDGDAAGYLLALPGALLAFAWKHLQRARQMRPADLTFVAGGFRVIGGIHSGRSFAWTEVGKIGLRSRKDEDSMASEMAVAEHPMETDDSEQLVELTLSLRSGEQLVLAATEDGVELPSLHELAGALKNGRELATRPPEVHDAPPEVLRCPQCHAPVRPTTHATTRCSHCSAEVPLPEALREKLRAAQLEARRPARLVASVLRQPKAGFVGFMFAFSAVFMLAAWPVALGVLWLNFSREALKLETLGYLALFLLACLFGFFGVIRGWLTDRHALRAIATGFSAFKPADEKAPLQCRVCFGPLPEDKPLTLVRCAYCSAPNLLAVAFIPRRAQLEDERSSLERALTRRTKERRRWRGAALAGVLLVCLSGWALKRSVSVLPTTPPPAANPETETPR